MNKTKISILLPTRGRTYMLDRSVSSLLDNADSPESIQWLLGFDNDDPESYEYFLANTVPKITKSGGTYSCMSFDPLGYHRLNVYVNSLASYAKGDWFVFWNDDAIMLDKGWDTVICSHTGKFCLQAFDTHNKHPYSIFPIVPREWHELIGHLSSHALNDAWLSQIAWMLDIVQQIDIRVDHDRHDLTGSTADDTYLNRIIFEGRPWDPRDFNHVEYRKLRLYETEKISQYLKERGYDMSWWESVKAGKEDPWTRMLAVDVNGQMSRQHPFQL